MGHPTGPPMLWSSRTTHLIVVRFGIHANGRNSCRCLQLHVVIRHLYKICLLTMAYLYAILKLDLAGAAPADQQSAPKAGWWGNPETACNPVVLWPTVWVPDAAASDDLKCGETALLLCTPSFG